MTAEPATYRTDEVARLLGLSRGRVNQLCHDGFLVARLEQTPGMKCRRYAIDGESVRGYYAHALEHPLRLWTVYPGRGARRRASRPYLQAVCAVYEMTPAVLFAKGRGRLEVEARQVLSYLLYADAGVGMTEVARLTRRDHSSAHNAIRKATEQPTEEVTWAIAECRMLIAQGREQRQRRAG